MAIPSIGVAARARVVSQKRCVERAEELSDGVEEETVHWNGGGTNKDHVNETKSAQWQLTS